MSTQPPSPADDCLTRILVGDPAGATELLPLVYDELRGLARGLLRGGGPATLQPTALVHEAWLKLQRAADDFAGRSHFLGVAAKAMRQVMVNHARDQRAQKRGGEAAQVTMLTAFVAAQQRGLDVLEVHDALDRLAELSARQARIAELRLFAGLSMAELACALDVSERTIKADWRFAKAWLQRELVED